MTVNSITVAQINELALQLDGSTKLLTPHNGADFRSALSRWSDTAIKLAGAVAVPRLDAEVSKLVKFASSNNIDLAVKGGGHSTGGTSSTNGGLVIDLSEMRKVTVDEATKLITVQGGALWEDVDNAAASKGLATVGGTVNHTGVGGLTLGGGFGWLSGQYGTAVDNIVSVKVVNANGDILTASTDENSDLFWAIRGAGHNFGVTVEFIFRGYDQPNEVYAGSVVFTPDKLPDIVERLNARMEDPDPKGASMLVFAKPPDSPSPVLVMNLFYNGHQSAAESYFASVLELEPVANMMKSMPYRDVNGMLNAQAIPGGRKALKAITFEHTVRPDYVQDLWEDFNKKLEDNPDLSETFLAIEFYDLAKTASIPVHATAFATRGTYRAGILGMAWTNAADDLANRAWARSVRDKCHGWIVNSPHYTPTSGVVYEYGNYLEPGDLLEEKPFGTNQRRLEELKQRFDPNCLFNKSSPITPAHV